MWHPQQSCHKYDDTYYVIMSCIVQYGCYKFVWVNAGAGTSSVKTMYNDTLMFSFFTLILHLQSNK